MKILALDTSTPSCSVAVVDDDDVLVEIVVNNGETHTRHLMPIIDRIFTIAGTSLSEMDGFAVSTGPGSFTGLRIGISTIKGLALATDLPVAGISSLDALAWQSAFSPLLICALIDARRGELYSATYRIQNSRLTVRNEAQALPPERVADMIDESCLMIGNGADLYRDRFAEMLGDSVRFARPSQNIIRASSVAQLGLIRLREHGGDDPGILVPYYIRPSDAEIARERKSNIGLDSGKSP
jgi:tRNA threonylcarbamoyladenosine biosynthesis protein TsaB